MSFGTETAGVEGAAGFTGDAGGAGYSGAALPGVPPGSSGVDTGTIASPSMMEKLKKLLQDPEVVKALGDATKHLGNTMGALNKMPPEMQGMLKQLISQGGAGSTGHKGLDKLEALGGQSTSPYMGDAASWIDPNTAQMTLKRLGIPFGGG